MSPRLWPLRRPAALALLLLLLAAGCERAERPPAEDTAAAPPPVAADTAAPVAAPSWDPSAGPVLFVNGDAGAPRQAFVVLPQLTDSLAGDSAALADSARAVPALAPGATVVELFSRAGKAAEVTLASRVDADSTVAEFQAGGCRMWPAARLAAAPPPWTVGFLRGRAAAVPLDSIETLARTDSARLAAEAARLASTVPADTAPAFRGLPFAVRTVRRFSPAPTVETLIAEAVRKVPQEANPLEEHTFLIAERRAGDPAGRYRVVYSERTSGSEEAVPTTEVLAAVALGAPRRPTLVVGRDFYEGMTYALLERTPAGRWRVRWSSAYTGC